MHCLQTSVFLNKNAGVSVHYTSLSLYGTSFAPCSVAAWPLY